MITIDRATILQVFGSLMEKPSLLSDIDKYQLEPSDFSTQLDRYIFTAIYSLYEGGAEKLHSIDIGNYLESNELAKKVFEEQKGIIFLQDCEALSEVENFPYYYNKLKKVNLIRDLQKTGRDVSSIYSEDPLDKDHNKINDKFETLTTTDIMNSLKGELASLENKYVLNSVVEESSACDGIDDLLEELSATPEIGLPLQGDIFNQVCRGARLGKLYLRSAGSGLVA